MRICKERSCVDASGFIRELIFSAPAGKLSTTPPHLFADPWETWEELPGCLKVAGRKSAIFDAMMALREESTFNVAGDSDKGNMEAFSILTASLRDMAHLLCFYNP